VAAGLFAVLTKPLKTALRSYYVYNTVGYAFRFIVASGITYSISNSVAEGRFVARNTVLKELVNRVLYIAG